MWSGDNAENIDNGNVLEVSLSAVVIAAIAEKTSKAMTGY